MATEDLPDGTKRVALSRPIVSHGGNITAIILREPRGRDYLRLGDPVNYARNPDGTVYAVENEEVIRSYVELCATDLDAPALDQLCLADAMEVKVAVLDFFRAARDRLSAS